MKKRNLFSFLRKYDELSFLLVRVNGEPWGAVERKAVSDVHKSSQMMERDSTHTSWFINILFIYISTLSISSFILVIILSLCFMKKKSTDVRFMTVCLCFFYLLLIFYADFERKSIVSSKVTGVGPGSYRLIRCQWSGLLLPLHWWGHFCSSWLSSILNMLESE